MAIGLYTLAILLLVSACTTVKRMPVKGQRPLDLEGHRGARGLMPENTIPSMKKAIDEGATTLELDVVISKDNQVVVSHEPYFSDVITTSPEGKYLTKKEASEHLIYRMPYDSIKKYDVGLKPHPAFPRQQKIRAYKPLLSELIDSVEAYAKLKGSSHRYNIEIKSNEGDDGVRHPDPKAFSDMVVNVLRAKGIVDRSTIQSFDLRPLQYIHKTYPGITLSYLVENSIAPLQKQLDKLGFVPDVYSPEYILLTRKTVQQCHPKGIKVVPWTVNSLNEMKSLIDMGVDGIISDYPDLFSQLK